MKKIKKTIQKEGKWIIVRNGEKQVRFRRSSKNGILLESAMNNPKGVKEEVLIYAIESKKVVPALSSDEQRLNWAKSEKRKDIEEIANNQSRALSILTNGKVYINICQEGLKFIIPDDLEEGFEILMDLVNPEDASKRMSVKGERLQKLNSFFKICGLDLEGQEINERIDFKGSGTRQLAQFMKSCAGYNIKSADLF